ncbi:MAG: glycoside hydrolase family 95 protein [Paramuribaculum sp.]|nr:glycoside hydrolase family 95 protein [Paramuribaculum sp.]
MTFKTLIASIALIPVAALAGCGDRKAPMPSADEYIAGNSIWFDTPTSSQTSEPWKTDDFSGSPVNPDREWESRSLPIGNGSLGGSILGSVARERVVINEKTLWMGGPGSGAEQYWAMNRKVNPATLDSIRQLLVNGDKATAGRMVSAEFRGTVGYDRQRFGTYTEMGEILVATAIDE